MPKTASRKTAAATPPDQADPAHPESAPAKGSRRVAGKGGSKRAKAAGAKAPGKVAGKPSAKKSSAKGPAAAATGASGKGTAKRSSTAKKARLPMRKTFLVAATRVGEDGATALQVYAAVTRSPAEALAAVRGALGAEVAVELTGKLSNRMAKSLGLKADEVRAI